MTKADADPLAATLQGDDVALARTLEGGSVTGGPATGLTAEHPGRYERAEELGRGGMGRVVLAVDKHLGREVAMKELLAQAASGDSGMSVGAAVRFLREARITGQLEHPSIVPVHELGQRDDGTIYYTMKRIRGRSLALALRESGSLAARLALIGHFRAACDAVAYAHSRGVVHRDLKPDNVMVGEFGETLVVDWGLAKMRGEAELRDIERRVQVPKDASAASTIDGHALGTPAYMSPEQARGEIESIDERSDVWGLGAILYEILTGRPPYVAESVLAVVQKVLDERPPRVREVCADAPPELAAIAERALSRDRGSRYPGARELAAEIAAWQDGRTVRAYEYSALELARRFFARNRAASFATLFVLAAIVGITLLAAVSYGREQRARSLAEQRGAEDARERERAEASAREAEGALMQALAARAEHALEEGDPSAAAVLAARALAHDPSARQQATREDAERRARAMASLIRAAEEQSYVFARELPGVLPDARITPDGRWLVFAANDRLVRVRVSDGERSQVTVPAGGAVLAAIDADRVVVSGAPSSVISMTSGERVLALPDVVAADARGGRFATLATTGEVVFYDERGAEAARLATSIRGHGLIAMTAASSVVVASSAQLIAERVAVGVPAQRIELSAPATAVVASPYDDAIAIVLEGGELVVLDDGGRWPVPVASSSVASSSVAWLGPERYASAERGDRVIVRAGARTVDTLHPSAGAGHRLLEAGGVLVAIAEPSGGALPSASVFRPTHAAGRASAQLPGAIADAVIDAANHRLLVAAGDAVFGVDARGRLAEPALIARAPGSVAVERVLVLDDARIAVMLADGRVGVVDGASGAIAIVFAPGQSPSDAGAFAYDATQGVILVVGADERVVRVRPTGEQLEPLSAEERALAIAASSRGAVALAAQDGRVRLLEGGRARVVERHDAIASAVAFSADGARLASGDGRGVVRIRDAETGAESASWPIAGARIEHLAWSSDGRRLVVDAADAHVRVIDVETGALVRIDRARGISHRAALAADGALAYASGRQIVRTALELPVARRDATFLVRWAEQRAGHFPPE